MPIYEYNCETCKTTKDMMRSIDERDLIVTCDSCKNHMKRVIAGFSKVYIEGVKCSETGKGKRK